MCPLRRSWLVLWEGRGKLAINLSKWRYKWHVWACMSSIASGWYGLLLLIWKWKGRTGQEELSEQEMRAMIHTRRERQKRFVLIHHMFQDSTLDHCLLFPVIAHEECHLFVLFINMVSKEMLYKQHYVISSQNDSGISDGSSFYVEWKSQKRQEFTSLYL